MKFKVKPTVKVPCNHYIYHGDVLNVAKTIPSNTFHALLSDPPYGLSFMNKRWDYDVPSSKVWRELLRIMRPGALGLVFGGSRTFHRSIIEIEDAGFEIRDVLMYMYGNGFPKSYDLSKGIDKKLGAKRKTVRRPMSSSSKFFRELGDTRPWIEEALKVGYHEHDGKDPVSPEAKKWDGYGTALKPSYEPIALIKKPTTYSNADNALHYQCGVLNIKGCRIGDDVITTRGGGKKGEGVTSIAVRSDDFIPTEHIGRHPANVIFDDEAEGLGAALRYFYCAKPTRHEKKQFNEHPTVKPIDLTTYLAKLIKLPNEYAKIIIPYSGSGSEMIGAFNAGWNDVTGIEKYMKYIDIANRRIMQERIQPYNAKHY